MHKRATLIVCALLAVLTGCSSATPTVDPDGPILTGFDSLPKSLATVMLSPTPNAPQAQATLDSRHPTNTMPPPTFTPTPTVFAGIFMGASTFSSNGLAPIGPRQIPILTLPPSQGNPGSVPPAAGNVSGGGGTGCVAPAAPFTNMAANGAIAQKLGCPTGNAFAVQMVVQPFQNGYMFWRDTKEIFALSTVAQHNGSATDTFWRVPDSWTEALPPNDPGLNPPAGMFQPVRGFGYAWRNNAGIRNNLRALSQEQAFSSTWQNFQHGWMMTSNNGSVISFVPLDGPPVTTGIHFGPTP